MEHKTIDILFWAFDDATAYLDGTRVSHLYSDEDWTRVRDTIRGALHAVGVIRVEFREWELPMSLIDRINERGLGWDAVDRLVGIYGIDKVARRV